MNANIGDQSANNIKTQDFSEIRRMIEAKMKEQEEQEND
jgi:hypothetical protein